MKMNKGFNLQKYNNWKFWYQMVDHKIKMNSARIESMVSVLHNCSKKITCWKKNFWYKNLNAFMLEEHDVYSVYHITSIIMKCNI